jgi:hypothetical protein
MAASVAGGDALLLEKQARQGADQQSNATIRRILELSTADRPGVYTPMRCVLGSSRGWKRARRHSTFPGRLATRRLLPILVLAYAPVAFAIAAYGTGFEHPWTPAIWRHTALNSLRIFGGGSVAFWALLRMRDLDAQ